MIITDTFVWINYPKSGSTFVRKALRELHSRRGFRILGRNTRTFHEKLCPELRLAHGSRRGKLGPHGVVSQIPQEFRHLPIVSSFRDPLDMLISLYEYADWKKEDVWLAPSEEVQELFPTFPDLKFREFVRYRATFSSGIVTIDGNTRPIGPSSLNFLMFFSQEHVPPGAHLRFKSYEDLFDSLARVRFLRTESLNEDLVNFLNDVGYSSSRTRFIRNLPVENASPRRASQYLDSATRDLFHQSEWLLVWLVNEFVKASALGLTKL